MSEPTEMPVTIDDLPWNAGYPTGYDGLAATRRLTRALTERAIPATAFVNCDRVDSQAPIQVWQHAGFELGNHSANHMDLSTRPLDAMRADGWRFISLDAAMSDPVYALPDVHTRTYGPSWLHRITPALTEEFSWERAKEAEIRAPVGG